MSRRLTLIGGGRMGEAIVEGLLRSAWTTPESVTVAEKLATRREQLWAVGGLAGRHPGLEVVDPDQLGSYGELEDVIVAVKPGDVEEACRRIAGVGANRVLSVAAGIRLLSLEGWLAGAAVPGVAGAAPAVIRAMPNTPSLVGAGAAAISAGTGAGTHDIEWAREVLGCLGMVVVVPEGLLDAVTGLSGSGPAYVSMLVEALIDAGVLVGLPRQTARDLAVQTVLGTARLLAESGESPETLRAGVTSPGGTTAAGLRVLEARAWRSAVIEAVCAAAERSAEIAAGG